MNHLYRPLLRALLLAAAVLLQPVACPAKIWTDISGRTIDAEILACDGKVVMLKSNKTGKEIKVPLDQLCMPDKAVALFKVHEQKASAAAAADPNAMTKAPDPAPAPPPPQPVAPPAPVSPPPEAAPPVAPVVPTPVAGSKEDTDVPSPLLTEEVIKEFLGDPVKKDADKPGGFDQFAESLEEGDYGGLIRGVGWVIFLAGLMSLLVVWALISTLGIYLISIFLDFKETFGTAVMFGIGSTAIRALFELSQAVMIHFSPTLAPTLDNILTRWILMLAVYYPFDAFLIHRIFRADLATSSRAAGAYFVWSRITARIIFALLTVFALSSVSDGAGIPPGLGQ